ncbi:unnamed protein product, partial [marine sediment metagenome]
MAQLPIVIKPAQSKKDIRRFAKFPRHIYNRASPWVPPLISEQLRFMDSERNPFFEHAEVKFFLAYVEKRIVGRIAAIVNDRHNEFHDEKTGFFGLFESIEEYDVARALFDAAYDFVRERGMERLRGPMNFSTNDNCGFLIRGYETPPAIMMPYNPSYYNEFAERYGMNKIKDLYAYAVTDEEIQADKYLKVAKAVIKRGGVTVRRIDLGDFEDEIDR